MPCFVPTVVSYLYYITFVLSPLFYLACAVLPLVCLHSAILSVPAALCCLWNTMICYVMLIGIFSRQVWLSLADHYLFQLKINWEQTIRFTFNERSNPDDEQLGMQIVKVSMLCFVNVVILIKVLLIQTYWQLVFCLLISCSNEQVQLVIFISIIWFCFNRKLHLTSWMMK